MARPANGEFAWCERDPNGEKRAGKTGQGRKTRSGEEKTVRGGKDGQGRNKTGEETTATKLPAHAADTRPALWPLSLSME